MKSISDALLRFLMGAFGSLFISLIPSVILGFIFDDGTAMPLIIIIGSIILSSVIGGVMGVVRYEPKWLRYGLIGR